MMWHRGSPSRQSRPDPNCQPLPPEVRAKLAETPTKDTTRIVAVVRRVSRRTYSLSNVLWLYPMGAAVNAAAWVATGWQWMFLFAVILLAGWVGHLVIRYDVRRRYDRRTAAKLFGEMSVVIQVGIDAVLLATLLLCWAEHQPGTYRVWPYVLCPLALGALLDLWALRKNARR